MSYVTLTASENGEEEGSVSKGSSKEDNNSDIKYPKLRFAKAYGFRNIQSILLSLKRDKCDFDYIEVMACPSGCINGGGQLKTISASGMTETPGQMKIRVAATEMKFHSIHIRKPEDNPLVKYLYTENRIGTPMSSIAKTLLHTHYHAVPALEELAPLATKW